MSTLGLVSRLTIPRTTTRGWTRIAGNCAAAAARSYAILGKPVSHRFRDNCQIRLSSTLPFSPIFEAIAKHEPTSPAIVHSASERTFSYGSLLHDVASAKDRLSAVVDGRSLDGKRIAFLAENSYDYVGAQA